MNNDHYKGMFATNGSGFHLTFENGWTVSVQWGTMNYCDHYDNRDYDAPLKTLQEKKKSWDSKTAEIAAWKHQNDTKVWYHFGSNITVKGRVSTDEVAAFIVMIADLSE